MIALIDGDILTYQIGFASDQRVYIVGEKEFPYKKEAIEYAEANGWTKASIIKHVTAEPIEFALHSLKILINSILENTGSTEYKIYLTGEGNFREAVAVTHKYKGNRDKAHKPIHYNEIRQYLVDVHKAEIVHGMEADDKIAMEHTKHLMYNPTWYDQLDSDLSLSMICSIDKDFNQLPGWHYNWRNKGKVWLEQNEADVFFWEQMLIGDSSDNVKGIEGIGPKRAYKALEGAKSFEEMEQRVKDIYLGTYGSLERFNENRQLLWLLRE